MTLIVGKTQVHLGWGALVGLILSTITTTVTATWAISDYKHAQEGKLDKIIAWQQAHSVKDSIQDVKLDTLFSWHAKSLVNTNAVYPQHTARTVRTSAGWYTERVINGKTFLEKLNN